MIMNFNWDGPGVIINVHMQGFFVFLSRFLVGSSFSASILNSSLFIQKFTLHTKWLYASQCKIEWVKAGQFRKLNIHAWNGGKFQIKWKDKRDFHNL